MSSEKKRSQKNLATLYNDLESHGISSLTFNKALFLGGGSLGRGCLICHSVWPALLKILRSLEKVKSILRNGAW